MRAALVVAVVVVVVALSGCETLIACADVAGGCCRVLYNNTPTADGSALAESAPAPMTTSSQASGFDPPEAIFTAGVGFDAPDAIIPMRH